MKNNDTQSERAGGKLNENNWFVETFQVSDDFQNQLVVLNENISRFFKGVFENFQISADVKTAPYEKSVDSNLE